MSIEAISTVAAATPAIAAMPSVQPAPEGFATLLDGIGDVNRQMLANDQAVQALAAGETDNLHQVMMNMEKTRVSFQLMLQVRNKLLDAYHELMRMQM